MKTTLLIAFFLLNVFAIYANQDTTKYWSWSEKVLHGSTNEVKGIKLMDDGSVVYSGYGYEISPGNQHAWIVGKLDPSGSVLWEKEYFGYADEGKHHIEVDDNGAIYIAGMYRSFLNLPNDTLVTNSNNDKGFFVRLAGATGDVDWVKIHNIRNELGLSIDANQNLILSGSDYTGDQKYNDSVVETVSFPSIPWVAVGYLTIDRYTGNYISGAFQNRYDFGVPIHATVVNRKVYNLLYTNTGFNSPFILKKTSLDLDTKVLTTGSEFVTANGYQYSVDLKEAHYIKNDKSWIVFFDNENQNFVLDQDTLLFKPYIESIVVKLDSNLNVLTYKEYSNSLDGYFSDVNDQSLVFTFGVAGNGIFGNDSIEFLGAYGNPSHNGYFIAKCDLDLNNPEYRRLSIDNNSGGLAMEIKNLDINSQGDFVITCFSGDDVIAQPDVIPAFNKSWKHLSVVSKAGIGSAPSSLVEFTDESLVVYPNPTTGILNFTSDIDYTSVTIMSLQGKQILSKNLVNEKSVKTEALKPGIYFISLKNKRGITVEQFVKH